MTKKISFLVGMGMLLYFLFGVAIADPDAENNVAVNSAYQAQDPYQHFNEKTFQFNTNLDEQVFQPIARGYSKIVPSRVRNSVSNFYQNISEPSIVINDLLQGDYVSAMGDTWRFFINSTFGLFGLFDVASNMNVAMPMHDNDFGLTLSEWGLNQQNYFVIPLWGPSTDVDFFSRLVNYYAFTVYPYINPYIDRVSLLGVYYLNERAQLLQYNNLLAVAALNPYVFQRNAYLQSRQSQLNQVLQNVHADYTGLQDSEPGYFIKPGHH